MTDDEKEVRHSLLIEKLKVIDLEIIIEFLESKGYNVRKIPPGAWICEECESTNMQEFKSCSACDMERE